MTLFYILYLYNNNGDYMKIYLDLILILNFFLDFILLISTGLILKRKINIKLITIGAFIGSLTIIILFFNINSIELFILKLLLSIIMIIISYPKLNMKYILYNLLIFYIVSIFLGGFLYMLNIMISYKHIGLIFLSNGLSINFIIITFISPLILFLYIKEQKLIKNKYNNYYPVNIYIQNQEIKLIGYIDSGNNLTFKNNPVILVDKRKVIFLQEGYRVIPYKVVNNVMMLKIYKCDKVIINNKIFKNIYLGICEDKINIDGIDVLLNNKLLEDI